MRGMTLIELGVVLLILVALAGLTLSMIQSTPRYSECVATDTTLANIREAIMGGAGQAGYWSDMRGVPPFDNNVSPPNASSLNSLFNNPTTQSFNPVTQRGWRGPYLTGGVSCTQIYNLLGKIPSGYTVSNNIDQENVCSLSGPLSSVSSHTVALDSFPVIASNTRGSMATVLVGSPIVLMQDATSSGITYDKYFLVSGGPSGGIETNPSNMVNRANDDRVLYLDSYDPSSTGNQPCSQ